MAYGVDESDPLIRRFKRRAVTVTLVASFASMVCDRMIALVVPFLILDIFHNQVLIGIFAACVGLAAFISPTWSSRIDRFLSPSAGLWVFAVVDLAAVACCLGAAASPSLGMGLLPMAGVLSGSAGMGLVPRRQVVLSDVAEQVGEGFRNQALTLEESASKLAIVASAPVAGIVLQVGSPSSALWVIMTIYGVALALYLWVGALLARFPSASFGEPADTGAGGVRRFAAMMAGSQAVPPQLRRGIVVRTVSSMLWFTFSLGLSIYGVAQGRGAIIVSVSTAAYGLGTIGGSIIAVALARGGRLSAKIAVGWIGSGLMFVGMGLFVDNLVILAVIAAFGGLCTPIGISALNMLLAQKSHGVERQQVFFLLNWSNTMAITIGSAIGGSILTVVAPQFALSGAGIVVLVAVLTLWIVPEAMAHRRTTS